MADCCGVQMGWRLLVIDGRPMQNLSQLFDKGSRPTRKFTFASQRKKILKLPGSIRGEKGLHVRSGPAGFGDVFFQIVPFR